MLALQRGGGHEDNGRAQLAAVAVSNGLVGNRPAKCYRHSKQSHMSRSDTITMGEARVV
jgi:hypothetical protein